MFVCLICLYVLIFQWRRQWHIWGRYGKLPWTSPTCLQCSTRTRIRSSWIGSSRKHSKRCPSFHCSRVRSKTIKPIVGRTRTQIVSLSFIVIVSFFSKKKFISSLSQFFFYVFYIIISHVLHCLLCVQFSKFLR